MNGWSFLDLEILFDFLLQGTWRGCKSSLKYYVSSGINIQPFSFFSSNNAGELCHFIKNKRGYKGEVKRPNLNPPPVCYKGRVEGPIPKPPHSTRTTKRKTSKHIQPNSAPHKRNRGQQSAEASGSSRAPETTFLPHILEHQLNIYPFT